MCADVISLRHTKDTATQHWKLQVVRLPSLKAIVHKEDITEQATLSEDGTAVLKLDIKRERRY